MQLSEHEETYRFVSIVRTDTCPKVCRRYRIRGISNRTSFIDERELRKRNPDAHRTVMPIEQMKHAKIKGLTKLLVLKGSVLEK